MRDFRQDPAWYLRGARAGITFDRKHDKVRAALKQRRQPMGEAVVLHDATIDPNSDLGRQLVVDLARFREGLVDEKAIRKKFRLGNDVWEALGDDDELIRAVEAEAVRRIADGSVKRERAQVLVARAPTVLGDILNDAGQSARHRIDSAKVLNDFASNGPAGSPASERFVIRIDLTAGGGDVLHFDKSIAIDAGDIDPYHPDDADVTSTPWGMFAAIPTRKKDDDGGQGHI
jgi:hypothetical protein